MPLVNSERAWIDGELVREGTMRILDRNVGKK